MDLGEHEVLQQTQFQQQYSLLNITAAGIIFTIALTSTPSTIERPERALLALPLVSTLLFSLWFHRAVILVSKGGPPNYAPGVHTIVRAVSLLVASLLNFIVIPSLALFLFLEETPSPVSRDKVLLLVDVGLLLFAFASLSLWTWSNYWGHGRFLRPTEDWEKQEELES